MATPLELYLLTFNCARTLIDPALLGTHLFNAWPKDRALVPDVVAVSLQEVAPIAYSFLGGNYIAPYLDRVDESVQFAARRRLRMKRNERDNEVENVYERLAVHSVGMTVAMVFVRREIRDRITTVERAGVGVGVWEMGNKGGVGIRITIDGKELTFVAMHLAPMEGKVMRRNQDWEDICRGLIFESDEPREDGFGEREPLLASNNKQSPTGLFKPNNHIFLFGDLNYRTSHVPPQPQTYKTYPQPGDGSLAKEERIALPDLFTKDQLTQERLANRTLHGFAEQPIDFAPTYKYGHENTDIPGPTAERADSSDDTDTDEDVDMIVVEPSKWTWARHRWPSWCDRILFYPPTDLTPGKYTSLPLLPSSDHRGVVLHVTLNSSSAETSLPGDDLRMKPPFALDPHWKARRAAARRYEILVGMASWVTLTTEGNAALAGLLGGALALYFLISVSGGRA